MARILKLKPSTQEIKAHLPEKGVECEYKLIDDYGGPLLHLSTFGSRDRESHRKSSQSMQIDKEIAVDLIRILSTAFGNSVVRDVDVEEDRLVAAYRRDPQLFRTLITNDEAARDVVAMAHRRGQVEKFRQLLTDQDYFEAEASKRPNHAGEEWVWQHFFEDNPWIFGVSLAGQLLTSWSDEKLEQVVAGASISGVGKRTDALLRTSGRIRSLVFAEFKTHKKDLLGTEYRSGCWSPSPELSGGVAQVQGTVHRAVIGIGERLQDQASDGSDVPDEFTYLLRPRSYLIIGNLDSLLGAGGGHHRDKIRSFELFRRQLVEPEILTFDELLDRAEWLVTSVDAASESTTVWDSRAD
ncbi:Shedu immune nuclease family protein [Nocardia sp. NPDC049149]|uniref:Shedu immune nuclease family protein n=1 Tax=Nocardia sp. NPDC049149 TaxID=3364315 RepID=UPI00371AF837